MRYLLVGFGNIGAKRKRLLGDRCVATVDPVNPAADHKTADAVPPDRYDAAIVATPNEPKLELLEKFLRLGKRVLVEKPLLFPDDATGLRLEALAKERGVLWYTSYNHRFEPVVAKLRERIAAVGPVYSARLHYGNGTVRNVMGSWRDGGLGVFEDLGCHLLDLAGWILGARGSKVDIRELRAIESKGVDRFTMATSDQKIVMEGSFVCWKNTFSIDVFGEKGSIHAHGLCKWGPTELIVRERIFPSGVPKETREIVEGPDVTWERDLEHFESLRDFSSENDRWISSVVRSVARPSSGAGDPPTAFVGMSHLGINSAAGWATIGRPAVGYDPDAALIESLRAGKPPFFEPGLAEALPGVRFTNDAAALGECPVVYVARDIPTDDENRSDLRPILELFDRIVPHAQKGATLVLLSQVPPGFTRSLAERVRKTRPDLRVIYQVETLIFGRAIERATKPERFIVGCDGPLPAEYERGLRRFGCPILPMRYESAELCKTAINLYLCGAVTYANSLSNLCERIGADWSEIAPALRLDGRIGPKAYIQPSLGIAGGNLERDLVTVRDLSRANGVDAGFVELILAYNDRRFRWALEAVNRNLPPNPTVAVWGLTYKKDTTSLKNSRSIRVIRELRAKIRAYDPAVRSIDLPIELGGREEILKGADGLLIMTDWDEFSKADVSRLRGLVVIDCVGALESRRRELDGVRYVSMGRP